MSDGRPLSLSVEKVRQEMLRGILVPRELVNGALATVASKLVAKETKFFSFKGRVTDKREVDDHGTQLAASDQIFSLAGLYAREREQSLGPPQVAMEVDSRTGVVRLVVGSVLPALAEPPQTIELAPSTCSPAEQPVEARSLDYAEQATSRRRVPVPFASMKRILLDELVD